MELLFRTFSRRWPTKWARVFSDKAARSVWKRDLELLGVDARALELALDRSVRMEWPPSPEEVRQLGNPTPADLGLPDETDAYREAVRAAQPGKSAPHSWSHPAVQRAAAEVGPWELLQWPESRSRPLFSRAYAVMVRRVTDGDDLSMPVPKALPARAEFTEEQQALLERGRRAGIAWSGDPWDTYRMLVESAERMKRHG